MATQDDVRRIAMDLPETTEGTDGFGFLVEGKAFVWAWQERLDPKRSRVPSGEVIAVRVANEFEKEPLIDMDPNVFFTEAHYNGYPAILVRLAAIDLDLLKVVMTEGWRCRASRRLIAEYMDALPATLAKPALRALAEAGYAEIRQLDGVSEAELRKLHGVGPNAIAELRRSLAVRGLALRE